MKRVLWIGVSDAVRNTPLNKYGSTEFAEGCGVHNQQKIISQNQAQRDSKRLLQNKRSARFSEWV